MGEVIKELQDLRMLEWSRTRHSSGSAGSFLKSYSINQGVKTYYKISNYDPFHGIMGHECVNEIIADRLLEILGIDHLSYDLIHAIIRINDIEYDTYISKSIDFKKEGESKVPFDVFYEMEHEKGETPFDFCISRGFGDYIYKMLIVDYLILNRDRHGANIEIIKDRGNRTIRMAPLFDQGLSFLFNCYSDQDLDDINPLMDKKVQCFVGSNSTKYNLSLIPRDKMISIPEMNDDIYKTIFKDLDNVISKRRIDAIWEFIKQRVNEYEDIRNNR